MSNTDKIEIILISTPSKVIDYPSLSLPAITGFLKAKGIRVIQRDLNIEIKNLMLSSGELDYLSGTLLPLLLRMNFNNPAVYSSLNQSYRMLKAAKQKYGFAEIQFFKEQLQNRDYSLLSDHQDILQILFNISKVFDTLFTFLPLYYAFYKINNLSFFLTRCTEKFLDEIKALNPAVIGFSVITTQNTYALWLARHIRQHYTGKIVFGGSLPTKLGKLYLSEHAFIDYVIVGDGEYPLYNLLKALRGKAELSAVPGLIYANAKGELIEEEVKQHLKADYEACFPDYEGFPLQLYLSPVLPILASRGCPWLKCNFCAHKTSFQEPFFTRSSKQVFEEMHHFYKKYGSTLFHFADETITGRQGVEIGHYIKASRIPFYWMSFGRLDDEFTAEILTAWYQGGARVIEWGLESGSQAVLNSMHKGIKIEKAQEIMHMAGRLGMKNKLLTWYNYPGESVLDVMRTIDFENKNVKNGYAAPMLALRQKFALQLGSPIAEAVYNQAGMQAAGNPVFKKIWYPGAVFGINGLYMYNGNDVFIKQHLIDDYLRDIRKYCKDNNIYIATNESISFDLVFKCGVNSQAASYR